MGGWHLWKLTSIAVILVGATAVVTGLVVAYWSGGETGPALKPPVESPLLAPPRLANRPRSSSVLQSRAATSQPARVSPQPAANPEPAANPLPAVSSEPTARVPTQEAIDACNRYAAERAGQQDKTLRIAKDALIGAVAGAAVGAAGGAIAGGGKGAGKGAAIGGVLGTGGGALYGLNEAKRQDERYRDAYALCMRSRGYGG